MTTDTAPHFIAMKRILVVEDNSDLAGGLRRNLEREGHKVSLAATAADALATLGREVPDLVVLDLGLPDRDGYHVLEQMRAGGTQCPVLILSARGLEADKVKAHGDAENARRGRARPRFLLSVVPPLGRSWEVRDSL